MRFLPPGDGGGTAARRFLPVLVLWAAAVLCLFPAPAKGGETPVTIEADRLEYEENGEICRASGNVLILYEGARLTAQEVLVNRETGDAKAEGDVRIEQGADRLEGARANFNFLTETGVLHDGKIFFSENHLYLQGKEIHKLGEDTYRVLQGKATTCDGETPDWSIAGEEVRVTVDGYGTIRHGTFRVLDTPVFYVPYFLFPAKKTRQSGFLLPRLAYSRDKNGFDITVPLFLAVSDRTDATLYQRWMDKRGFQEGAEFRYCVDGDHSGVLYGDYLRDGREPGTPERISGDGGDASRNRWSWYWNHNSTFAGGFYGVVDLKKVSDRWYFQDFSTENYFAGHWSDDQADRFRRVSFFADQSLPSLDSSARLVKDWDRFNLTALAQYTDNFQTDTNEETLQKYPQISLTGFPAPIPGTPFHAALDGSFTHYYRQEGSDGELADLYPKLSLPLERFSWFQVTPELGLKYLRWDGSSDRDGEEGSRGDRGVVTARIDATSEVSRVYAFRAGSVDKVKHTIMPEIEYLYIPDPGLEDCPDYVEPLEATNAVICSLTNVLTARMTGADGKNRYWDVFRLKLSQTLDIAEMRKDLSPGEERKPLGLLGVKASLTPNEFVYLSADAAYEPNDGFWKKTDYYLQLRDGRGDKATVEYLYTRDSVEELNVTLRARCTKTLDLGYILKENLKDKQTVEATYALRYRRQCWALELSYSEKPDDRQILVSLVLFGLGQGWPGGGTSW